MKVYIENCSCFSKNFEDVCEVVANGDVIEALSIRSYIFARRLSIKTKILFMILSEIDLMFQVLLKCFIFF